MKLIGTFTIYSTYYTRISKKICSELEIGPGDRVVILKDEAGRVFLRRDTGL